MRSLALAAATLTTAFVGRHCAKQMPKSFCCFRGRRVQILCVVRSCSSSASVKLFEQRLLNDEQEIAVRTPDKCVRVVAGPGSGKTLVLTHRIAHEITNNAVEPENILCITFTNKAAQELRDRLQLLLGNEIANKLFISTFHSFCARFLRQILPGTKSEGGLSRYFVIYDDADGEKVLKGIYAKVVESHLLSQSSELRLGLPIDFRDLKRPPDGKGPIKLKIPAEDLKRGKSLVSLANLYKLQLFVAKMRSMGPPARSKQLTDDVLMLARLYEEQLRANNAVDFDDLISLTIYELHRSSKVRKAAEDRWSYVLVDEFQDTDRAQYELIRLLCSRNQNLFVVGDVDQAIYGWRGAESKNMQYSLSKDFPNIASLQLRRNYRSTKCILGIASRIIANSQLNRRIGQLEALELVPVKPAGMPVKVCWLGSPEEESQFVVHEILHKKKGKWEDCAILYRTHRQSFFIESSLVRAGIPYRILGATALFSHKVVKDLLQYLQFILNGDDELALSRIINTPPRGIGEKSVLRLKEYSALQNVSLPKALVLLKGSEVSHKELRMTQKARTAVHDFCDMISSLVEMSHHESVTALLHALIHKTGYLRYIQSSFSDESIREKNLQYIDQLLETAETSTSRHGKGRSALYMFLQDAKLISEAVSGSQDGNPNAVSLSTLHAAKGMEFKWVFIVGVNKGTLPHENSDPEEERRLFYVGITRAQEQLYLTHTHGYCPLDDAIDRDDDEEEEDKLWRRQRVMHQVSGFLNEIMFDQGVSLYPDSWNGRLF